MSDKHEFIKEKIHYKDLNAKQKEAYNFQKVSALLADYGYITIKLDNDWNGADFIAVRNVHAQESFIKVQLKARPIIAKKYINKNLHLSFPIKGSWFLIKHDKLLNIIEEKFPKTLVTDSWVTDNFYTWKTPPSKLCDTLTEFRISD